MDTQDVLTSPHGLWLHACQYIALTCIQYVHVVENPCIYAIGITRVNICVKSLSKPRLAPSGAYRGGFVNKETRKIIRNLSFTSNFTGFLDYETPPPALNFMKPEILETKLSINIRPLSTAAPHVLQTSCM